MRMADNLPDEEQAKVKDDWLQGLLTVVIITVFALIFSCMHYKFFK